VSFKDQQRRRRAAEKRGRRGTRRASAMLLRQAVLHPIEIDHEAAIVADWFGLVEGQGDGGSE